MQVAPSSPLVEILKFNEWSRRWTELGGTQSFSGSKSFQFQACICLKKTKQWTYNIDVYVINLRHIFPCHVWSPKATVRIKYMF